MSVFFVCGIHGAGKTTLCQKLSIKLEIPFFSSSSLIREFSKDAVSDSKFDKRVKNIVNNQQILVSAVQKKLEQFNNLILDGHTTIINQNNEIENIDSIFFYNMRVTALILLDVIPEIVKKRLEQRDGISPQLESIARHIDMERTQARIISTEIGIPLFSSDGEESVILSKIHKLLEI